MDQNLKVIGFSDDQVILENEEKDIIYWPKNKLPLVPEIGQKIKFSINSSANNNQAHNVINELLNIKPK